VAKYAPCFYQVLDGVYRTVTLHSFLNEKRGFIPIRPIHRARVPFWF
jgi:hypothetical protein